LELAHSSGDSGAGDHEELGHTGDVPFPAAKLDRTSASVPGWRHEETGLETDHEFLFTEGFSQAR
jgi:hypothetical protein